jgi:hypothetical protein
MLIPHHRVDLRLGASGVDRGCRLSTSCILVHRHVRARGRALLLRRRERPVGHVLGRAGRWPSRARRRAGQTSLVASGHLRDHDLLTHSRCWLSAPRPCGLWVHGSTIHGQGTNNRPSPRAPVLEGNGRAQTRKSAVGTRWWRLGPCKGSLLSEPPGSRTMCDGGKTAASALESSVCRADVPIP